MEIFTVIGIMTAGLMCLYALVWVTLSFYTWYSIKQQQKRREEIRRKREQFLKEYRERRGL